MTTALRKTLALLVAMMMVFAVAVMAMPSVLAEGTDEDQVTEDEEVIDEETDDTDVSEDDVPADEDETIDDTADEDAPKTGDASANMIVVAAAAALVAAGALTFVMKKARN